MPSPVLQPAPQPTAQGWLRIELTHAELSKAELGKLTFLPLDELWTRTDVGETGFASLFLSRSAHPVASEGPARGLSEGSLRADPAQHFRVRLALALDGYVATVTEERAVHRPQRDSTAVRLSVDLIQQAFDLRAPPEVGVGDELVLHLQPSAQLLLSVDNVPFGRCEVLVFNGRLGVQLAPKSTEPLAQR